MWYVMQVFTGKEENTKLQCEKLKDIYPQAFERIIIPYAKNRMKYGNSWDMVKKILFPGYIFIVTDNQKAGVRHHVIKRLFTPAVRL